MEKFLSSIYLGDRHIKSIDIDALRNQVRLQIDLISRTNPSTGNWDFYSEGDITNGWLVFADVKAFELIAPDGLPNSDIVFESVAHSSISSSLFDIKIHLGAVDDRAFYHNVGLSLRAADAYLVDPNHPDAAIR
jgi:hypothetical protein